MTFTSGDSLTPLASLLNQAVTEGTTYTDTQLAVVDWTTFTPTQASNFTAGVCRYRRFGPIVEIRLAVTRSSGSTLTANSVGDIANTPVFTGVGFPAEILPSDTQYFRGFKSTSGVIGGRFYTSGQVNIEDMYPTATLTTGAIVYIKALYMVG